MAALATRVQRLIVSLSAARPRSSAGSPSSSRPPAFRRRQAIPSCMAPRALPPNRKRKPPRAATLKRPICITAHSRNELSECRHGDAAEGITLGRHYDDATQRVGGKVVYEGERHVLLFGPNGTGKGTRFLIPNLLSIKDRSIIVIDPKGELAAVTADYRRTVGDVVMLNPFNVLGLGSAGFNPLATLDPKSPNFYDDAAALGEALIKIEGKDPHWAESAQGLVGCSHYVGEDQTRRRRQS